MRSLITDSVVLPAPAQRLFEMYLDPVEHAAFTGHPVTIGSKRGARFAAFGDQLTGHVLHIIAPRLIVQSWRSTQFRVEDPDSTLILTFTPEGVQGRIDLVHLDVPDHDLEGVTEGWGKFYWIPWRDALARETLSQEFSE